MDAPDQCSDGTEDDDLFEDLNGICEASTEPNLNEMQLQVKHFSFLSHFIETFFFRAKGIPQKNVQRM